jgi:hypothetical protein
VQTKWTSFISYKSVVYDVLGLKMFNPCLLIDVGLSRFRVSLRGFKKTYSRIC